MTTTVIDVWVIRTDQPPEVLDRLHGLLDPDERDRAAAATDPVQADRFTAIRGVVRLLTAGRLGIHPAELSWRHGPHGKPEPVQNTTLRLSWSGSDALAVLALADGRRVGADVEALRDAAVAARVARRYFPPEDAAEVTDAPGPEVAADRFTRLWCRREAVVKVYGGRLAQGLGLRLSGSGAGSGAGSRYGPVLLPHAGELDPGPCLVRDADVPGAYRAAIAAEGAGLFRLRSHHWSPAHWTPTPSGSAPPLPR